MLLWQHESRQRQGAPRLRRALHERRHPPIFATNDFNGSPAVLQLTGSNQKELPKEAFLDRVAQPMRIHGTVMQIGNTLLLRMESSAIASHSFRHPPEQGR